MIRALVISCVMLIAPLCALEAQTPPDTIRLGDLRSAALARDPRAGQVKLLELQSALRLRNIAADALPVLSLDGMGQYQSDVVSVPIVLPGITLPTPKHDAYDARLNAQQRIYDPTRAPRQAIERAQLAESQARVRTSIFAINESVNSAFFTALRSQTQAVELQIAITDLEAQLAVADARVREATALAGESNALRAEILRRRQAVAEQTSIMRAAMSVLSDLTGRDLNPAAPLSIPDLSSATAFAATAADTLRERPEYEQFDRARKVLELTEDARSAQDRPRVNAFGRLGYGRPGLNPLTDKFDTYWIAGVQVQWSPWTWGSSDRDRQIASLQRQIVTTEEASFRASIRRAIEQDVAALGRLETALVQDEQIIALRESILAETRARYAEAVVTSAEYVDKQTDVLAARLARSLHRVELAQARARLLTTLGIEVR